MSFKDIYLKDNATVTENSGINVPYFFLSFFYLFVSVALICLVLYLEKKCLSKIYVLYCLIK